MAAAFGLGQPVGARAAGPATRSGASVEHLHQAPAACWLKRFWADDELPWRDQLRLAMQHRAEGLSRPASPPRRRFARHGPVFGSVARIDGHGLFRAFPFIEHRPLADTDDVAEWIGRTLALTHRLQRLDLRPAPNYWYCQFPPVEGQQWSRWLREGEATGAGWAPALRAHLDLVLQQASRVEGTFNASPPYALTHRDVEPWNVLMASDGPVLIDWDTTGPESLPLEAAVYVFTKFALRGRRRS